MQRNCQLCIAYALVQADVVEHENEARAFDDQYEAITDAREDHVARVHGDQPPYPAG